MAEVPSELVIEALREQLSELSWENAILRAQLKQQTNATGDAHVGTTERGGSGGGPVSR